MRRGTERPGRQRNARPDEESQRVINASISSCIRCLRSSDQAAPGFWFNLLCGRGRGAVLISEGDFRAEVFSLRMGRGDAVLAGMESLIREVDGSLGLWWLGCIVIEPHLRDVSD
jgi:hypothetical protein